MDPYSPYYAPDLPGQNAGTIGPTGTRTIPGDYTGGNPNVSERIKKLREEDRQRQEQEKLRRQQIEIQQEELRKQKEEERREFVRQHGVTPEQANVETPQQKAHREQGLQVAHGMGGQQMRDQYANEYGSTYSKLPVGTTPGPSGPVAPEPKKSVLERMTDTGTKVKNWAAGELGQHGPETQAQAGSRIAGEVDRKANPPLMDKAKELYDTGIEKGKATVSSVKEGLSNARTFLGENFAKRKAEIYGGAAIGGLIGLAAPDAVGIKSHYKDLDRHSFNSRHEGKWRSAAGREGVIAYNQGMDRISKWTDRPIGMGLGALGAGIGTFVGGPIGMMLGQGIGMAGGGIHKWLKEKYAKHQQRERKKELGGDYQELGY